MHADAGGDPGQRLTGEQSVGERQSVLQGQIPLTDRPGSTIASGSHHRRCVARTGRVIHDRAVGMNPRVAALADAVTPIPASAFVDPDLPSRAPGRPARINQFKQPAFGLHLVAWPPRLIDEALGHQHAPRRRGSDAAGRSGCLERARRAEHLHDPLAIDPTPLSP